MLVEKVHVNSRGVELTAYLLDSSPDFENIQKRPAILVFPGGAYYFTSDREAEPIALKYAAEGYHTFVLRYTVGETANFETALEDAEDALKLIRSNHETWKVDPEKIGVIGFSAGGHLAASLGTMGKERPNALILAYPCILSSMNEILAFPVPSADQYVDEFTPPTFLFSTFEDELVPIENTICFMQALNEQHIPFESHIFQRGIHGLSLGQSHTSSGRKKLVDQDFAQWFKLSIAWLHKIFDDYPAENED